jgi:hypothetical protein
VEPYSENIEEWMRRQGYTEEEAEVAYHLGRAEDLMADMFAKTFESGSGALPRNQAGVFRMSQIEPHFRALFALLDRRVHKRDRPDSVWRPGDPHHPRTAHE